MTQSYYERGYLPQMTYDEVWEGIQRDYNQSAIDEWLYWGTVHWKSTLQYKP